MCQENAKMQNKQMQNYKKNTKQYRREIQNNKMQN